MGGKENKGGEVPSLESACCVILLRLYCSSNHTNILLYCSHHQLMSRHHGSTIPSVRPSVRGLPIWQYITYGLKPDDTPVPMAVSMTARRVSIAPPTNQPAGMSRGRNLSIRRASLWSGGTATATSSGSWFVCCFLIFFFFCFYCFHFLILLFKNTFYASS